MTSTRVQIGVDGVYFVLTMTDTRDGTCCQWRFTLPEARKISEGSHHAYTQARQANERRVREGA